eukprot:gb/GECG01004810.1/.p1 GENE.gb/GECG01004810.1/~~gb/GECG01004810.1/.p1  ORF type:complete len:542 (+),score=61.79 gb/GECG01004810.1/:1-1626(+)
MDPEEIYHLTEDERSLFVSGSRLEDNYELREKLGSGAFANVRSAVDRRTGSEVAVKIMNERLATTNPRLVRMILHEVYVMKKLAETMGQSGVLGLIEAYYDHGRVALVMPKCNGGDLFGRIFELAQRNEKYTEQDCAHIFNILFQHVQSLHESAKFLHNDLKHEHFMLETPDTECRILLTDFGYATSLPSDGINGELNGTGARGSHGYMAPEIFERYAYSAKSDCWAMGVALYIALKAQWPFQPKDIKQHGPSAIRKCAQIIQYGSDLDGLSEDAKDLIRKLLEVDPQRRIGAAEALEHPFLKRWRLQKSNDLDLVSQLERFRARQRFRGACRAVEAGSYMNRCGLLKSIIKKNGMKEFEIPSIQVDKIRQVFFLNCQSTNQGNSRREHPMLTPNSFKEVMKDLGLDHLPLERMFDVFDSNGDGVVAFKEFLCGVTLLNGVTAQTLRCCFDIFDCDGNGALDPTELMNILQLVATGDEEKDGAISENLQLMMDDIDIDGDGYITFEEFEKGVQQYPVLANALLGEVRNGVSTTDRRLFGNE